MTRAYATKLLKQRAYLACASVFALSSFLGYLLWIEDLAAARIAFAMQTFILVALPWSTYREVKRAYKGEPTNDHEDVLVPWRIVLCLWAAGAFGFVIFAPP